METKRKYKKKKAEINTNINSNSDINTITPVITLIPVDTDISNIRIIEENIDNLNNSKKNIIVNTEENTNIVNSEKIISENLENAIDEKDSQKLVTNEYIIPVENNIIENSVKEISDEKMDIVIDSDDKKNTCIHVDFLESVSTKDQLVLSNYENVSTNVEDISHKKIQNIETSEEKNSKIDEIIHNLKSENIINKIDLDENNENNENNKNNENNENKYTLNETEINKILNNMSVNENITKNEEKNIKLFTEKKDNELLTTIYDDENYEILDKLINNYTLDNLKYIFHTFDKAIILVDIIDGNIKYIEKKGQESRNQSVIDILHKTNNYKKLPNCQFLIFTNDFIDNLDSSNYPFLFTLCKNNLYNTTLFPNFNFNNWLEANIEDYQDVYKNFINNQISWNEKEDKIFWSGADTNIIRNKIHKSTISDSKYIINLIDRNTNNNKYYTIYEHKNYKYLLNMNGYSYGGRLNYLFLSGSCVIILKNEEKHKQWDEFFYKNFIPNEDYIEILYNDNENAVKIIERINNAIELNNCEKIAENCLNKAKKVFQIENIYEYVYNKVMLLSQKNTINDNLKNNIIYTPPLNHYFKNRLNAINNNINFFFQGNDLELKLIDYKNQENKDFFDIINIKMINNNTQINLNNNIIYDKYTPYIVHTGKSQNYNINIQNKILNVIVEKKFNLVQCNVINQMLENNEIQFNISEVEIKTIDGGWWIV